jgi:hypothetical protein
MILGGITANATKSTAVDVVGVEVWPEEGDRPVEEEASENDRPVEGVMDCVRRDARGPRPMEELKTRVTMTVPVSATDTGAFLTNMLLSKYFKCARTIHHT